MKYTPECWIMVKIVDGDDFVYKILAGWYGSYLSGQSWQLNSGIVSVEEDGDFLNFHGSSGSVYACHKTVYRTNMETRNILEHFKKIARDEGGSCIELDEAEALSKRDFSK